MLLLTGCGDRIVADHNWYAVVDLRVTTLQPPLGGIPTTTVRISGRLRNGLTGKPAANTLVQETCVSYTKDGLPSLYNCRTFLNAGNNVYVAGGMVDNPLKSSTVMTDSPNVGRLVLTPLGPPSTTVGLKISALTGSG